MGRLLTTHSCLVRSETACKNSTKIESKKALCKANGTRTWIVYAVFEIWEIMVMCGYNRKHPQHNVKFSVGTTVGY